MNLSLYTGSVKPYLEYGWVCAPNATGQLIAANTITTLYISDEIADTGGFGSLSAGIFPSGTASATSQITLAAGTYYFEAFAPHATSLYNTPTLGLYNITDTRYETRQNCGYGSYGGINILKGQISLSAIKSFELRFVSSSAATIGAAVNQTMGTNSTAGADQRTTIKLWKLA